MFLDFLSVDNLLELFYPYLFISLSAVFSPDISIVIFFSYTFFDLAFSC